MVILWHHCENLGTWAYRLTYELGVAYWGKKQTKTKTKKNNNN